MTDYRSRYERWLASDAVDEATKAELRAIAEDEKEIEDRFYKDLEFGTGGLRGILDAGTNRMNVYTVRRATQGLANYLLMKDPQAKEKGVAIAYDSRHQSDVFALETAAVFNG
ncbi:MAG: phospho-sugar mutase, partial [Clostridia bacterium]